MRILTNLFEKLSYNAKAKHVTFCSVEYNNLLEDSNDGDQISREEIVKQLTAKFNRVKASKIEKFVSQAYKLDDTKLDNATVKLYKIKDTLEKMELFFHKYKI